jgi:RNA polymerase sigma-70 factor, ECF subfamily
MHPILETPENERPEREEFRLIADVLRKERKATAEFVSRCVDWVYPFISRRLIPRKEAVEDIVQEVLLAAWRNLPTFRGDASLRTWILGIARHKVDDYYRGLIQEAEVREDEITGTEPADTPLFEERLDGKKRHQRIERILSALPEAYGVVLLWRYHDEKSTREMAELAGKSEKAIERLLARARQQFRKRWNDDRFR